MQVIKKNNKVLYKADENKKLLFKGNYFSEIVLDHESKEIKEVRR